MPITSFSYIEYLKENTKLELGECDFKYLVT